MLPLARYLGVFDLATWWLFELCYIVGAGIEFMSCIAGSVVFVRLFVGCILHILLQCHICNWWHVKDGDSHVDSVM